MEGVIAVDAAVGVEDVFFLSVVNAYAEVEFIFNGEFFFEDKVGEGFGLDKFKNRF